MSNIVNLPPIGFRVRWFNQADRNDKPVCADVVDLNGNGSIDLVLTHRNGVAGDKPVVRGVRHLDDPELAANPRMAFNSGAWDFVPGLEIAQPSPNSSPEKIKAQTEREILDMAEQGLKPGEIAGKICKKGYTKEAVGKIIQQAKEEAAANA